MCLLEQIERHHLNHVNHLVVISDLLYLVEIIQKCMLSLINMKDVLVGLEQGSKQKLGRDYTFERNTLVLLPRQTQHIKGLERRDFGQAIVETVSGSHQLEGLLEAELARDLKLMLVYTC